MVGWYQGGYEKLWSVTGGHTVSEKKWRRKIKGQFANLKHGH